MSNTGRYYRFMFFLYPLEMGTTPVSMYELLHGPQVNAISPSCASGMGFVSWHGTNLT